MHYKRILISSKEQRWGSSWELDDPATDIFGKRCSLNMHQNIFVYFLLMQLQVQKNRKPFSGKKSNKEAEDV